MVFTLGTTRDEGTGDLGLNQLLVTDWRERGTRKSLALMLSREKLILFLKLLCGDVIVQQIP